MGRFVAIRVTALQAEAMRPILRPNALVLIDRHHDTLTPYRPGALDIHAVASGNSLLLRYVTLNGNRLILRPYSLAHPVELIDLAPGQSPSDFIVGRAAFYSGEL
jgi:hypothetical protein